MNQRRALAVFSALSQETRMQIVRILVVAGPTGMAAGALAGKLDISPSNISFHLKELEHSGLISAQRQSRSIIYTASYDILGGLIRFLMEDCCSGHPEICTPMATVSGPSNNAGYLPYGSLRDQDQAG